MKKNILIFGLISGLILSGYIISFTLFEGVGNAVVGYSSMIIAFSFIFVAIKNFRDKYNEGVVTFGKAFLLGLGITLVGSTVYVLAWVIDYYIFIPDFMDKYAVHLIKEARDSGLTGAALDKKIAEVKHIGDLYKSPVMVVLFTYLEVVPVGLLISVFTALILKRKTPRTATPVAA